ncbi:hypothetical protein ABFS83_02G137600 [Erythranthe nasuta]
MSDRQSKNYDEAKKLFFSGVADRTRSKRGGTYDGTYYETSDEEEAHGISSGFQTVEETNASYRSWGVSAPIPPREQNSPSCDYETGSEGVSAPHDCRRRNRKRKIQSNPARRVSPGNSSRDMYIEEIEIERSNAAGFKNKKTKSASKMELGTRRKLDEGFSGSISRKNFDVTMRDKASPYVNRFFSSKDFRHRSDHGFFLQRGNNSVETEKLGRVEFRAKRNQSMSNIGPSNRRVINDRFAATSSKNVFGVSKSMCYGSFSPEHDEHHFNRGWRDQSISSLQKGNRKKATYLNEDDVEIIDKAEFLNQKYKFMQKIGFSTKKKSNEGYSIGKNLRNACDCFDQLCLQESESDSDDMVPEEFDVEEIDEAMFENQKTRFGTKVGPTRGQELNRGRFAASSSKKKPYLPDDSETDPLPSPLAKKGNKNAFTSSKESMFDRVDEAECIRAKLRSASMKNIGPSKPSTEKVDKGKKKIKVAAFSRMTESDEDCNRFLDEDSSEDTDSYSSSRSSSENTVDLLQDDETNSFSGGNKIQIGVASRTRSRMGITKKPLKVDSSSSSGNRNAGGEESEPESPFDSAEIEVLHVEACEVQKDTLPDVSAEKSVDCLNQKGLAAEKSDECRKEEGVSAEKSDERRIEEGLAAENSDVCRKEEGLAARKSDECRKEQGLAAEKSDECRKEQGLAAEKSDECRKEQVLAAEKSDECRKEERLAARKSDECRKEEGLAVKHALESGLLSNIQKEVSNCEQPVFRRRKFSSRKRKLSPGVSSKKTKGEKAQSVHEVINRIFGGDVNADEGLRERRNEKIDEMPKFTDSKQLMDCDEAEEVQTKDSSQADVREQLDEVSPPELRDDSVRIQSDDILQDKIDATSSDIQTHGSSEKVDDVPEEIKKPTEGRQVTSRHYDFCTMLAHSVLGIGPMLDASDEEAEMELQYKTQVALPTRFRFEDEVPEERETTEHEREMEGLWDEFDVCLALQQVGSFCPEIDEENELSPSEETQHARCARGRHELILQDEEGLICKYCYHVELGPKDVMPDWVERIYRESERKRDSELEHHLKFNGMDFDFSIDNLAEYSNSCSGTVWSLNPVARESMYEHQQEGFEFLWKNLAGSTDLDELRSSDPGKVGGCIISHAPGTGKTRLTIVFIESYLRMFPYCRPMIIAPASMLLTWEEEFKKWNVRFPFFNLNNPEILGNENKKAAELLEGGKRGNQDAIRWVKIFSWNTGRSILGISYSLFEKLTGEKHLKKEKLGEKRNGVSFGSRLESQRQILLEKPGLVILDEGHTPRNQRSNIWNVLLKLQTQKRVILSGTPFQNNFAELFNTLRLVRPAVADVLAHERTFSEMVTPRSRRTHKGEIYHQQSTLNPEVVDRAVDKLKLHMSPFVHVHRGTILKQSLPGLMDCVVFLNPPPLQKSLIERLEGLPNTFEFEHKVALISVHPYLFKHSDSPEEQQLTGIDMAAVEASRLKPNEGVKTKFILELVRLSVVMNEKVLIFSQYILPLQLINDQLKEFFKWGDGKQILQMRGKLDQKQRQVLINVFNDPKSESKVMLASTKCCSEGISLVGASRVVLLDVVWNPSVERQAISRAYRIGQKKFVYTYHLMTSGTTEADKYCRQAEKDRLSELVFSSSNESDKQEHPSLGIEDRILEEMVGQERLKEMFVKIINQPKDTDLIQTFGLPS